MTDQEILDFIEDSHWIFAKTMPGNPHVYALRKNCNEQNFIEFVEHIREFGEEELFEAKMYRCFCIGGRKYWTMGDAIEKTILINRAKK